MTNFFNNENKPHANKINFAKYIIIGIYNFEDWGGNFNEIFKYFDLDKLEITYKEIRNDEDEFQGYLKWLEDYLHIDREI